MSKKYGVHLPFAGTLVAEVVADSKEEAIDIAHESAFDDVIFIATEKEGLSITYEDINTIDKINTGNVCLLASAQEVEAWEIEETDE